jgi:hypothetical protein
MKQYFHIFFSSIQDRQAFKTGDIEFVPLNVHGDVNALKADGLSPAILTMSIIVGVAFALYVVRVSCKYIQKKKKKMNVRKVSFFLLLNLCKLHSRWRGTRWVCRG